MILLLSVGTNYLNFHLNITWLTSVNRDGVSDCQFYQVLLYELDAIRKVNILLGMNTLFESSSKLVTILTSSYL